jgi:phage tail tape-measure protein
MLLCALVGACLVLWWRASVDARERANTAARAACEGANVQLLDGTVVFQRLRATRDDAGRCALRRTYVFDYSEDGATRRHGFVILRGAAVEVVGLGPTLVPGTRH